MFKKNFKRIIAMALTVSMMMGMSTSVFASENQPRYVPDEITLTIYAATGVGSSLPSMDFGHSYITVENFCQRGITVGKLAVANGNSVSLGTWNDDNEHNGIYYNRELRLDDNVYYSYSRTITEAQLAKLNAYVNSSSNNVWSVGKTCTSFAIGAWSSTGLGGFTSTPLPSGLMSQIQYKPGYNYGRSLPQDYSVYYVNGSGTLVYSASN